MAPTHHDAPLLQDRLHHDGHGGGSPPPERRGAERAPTVPSRRSFLKGIGLVAGGAPLLPGGRALAEGPADADAPSESSIPGLRVLGRDARPAELTVNGTPRRVLIEPRTTLLDVLRRQLGVTGPKEVCDRGSCGACTVLVDGVAVYGCMMLAHDAGGRDIRTVESIADDPVGARLVDAFCEHDAAQCGFCIPGFVTRAREVVGAASGPLSPDDVREQLAGNLCRCGTYSKIFDAVLAATGASVARVAENNVALENEGARVDVRDKVTGAARFTADMQPAGMIYARFIRAPFGSGRVAQAAVAAANAIAGVLEVELPSGARGAYVGARLGHVAAESPEALDDAMAALALTFRVGEVRTDPWEFYDGPPAPDAETQQQLAQMYAAGAAVVEATYATQSQTHSALEPHGLVVDHRGDTAEAWASTQGTFSVRDGLVGPCGLEASKIVVHCENVGGGFGAKFGPGAEGELAARLSKKFRRPCRVMLNRREEHVDGGNRPGSIQYMKIAADADGKLIGGRIDCVGIVGHAPGGGRVNNPFAYDFGQVERTERDITLSVETPRAFRAPGHPQGVFAVESMIDELAERLGLDPLAMRATNETSQRRVRQAQIGARLIGWDRRLPNGSARGRVRRGLGMGAAHWHTWPSQCEADCLIHRDGRVEVASGVQDIGTGTKTVLVDVAADQLGLPRGRITARVGDSRLPEGPGSGGSVTARSVAPAIRDACEQAKGRVLEVVARELGVETAHLRVEAGVVHHRDGATMPWERACALLPTATISARGRVRPEHVGFGDTSATQFVDLSVDTETGVIHLHKVVAVQACGQVINRLMAENQVCGGVIQGLSFALLEERLLDPATGGMVNPNLEWYKISGTSDVPEIVPVLDMDAATDTGVRGIGEPTTIPTAGAVANAVANAIGARVRSLPITPEKVLAALAAREQGAQA